MKRNYFHKPGLNLSHDKDMFEFIKSHLTYYTMNSWNGCTSIANNVKIYNLNLEGDCWTALAFLEADDYFSINQMIEEWEFAQNGYYSVGFNGRSCGYLVLYRRGSNQTILPDFITDCDNYEEYKEYCKAVYGSVAANHLALRDICQDIQNFDKLCDELREYVNKLSLANFGKEQMEDIVDLFNMRYDSDMEKLNISPLVVAENGSVDISNITTISCLTEGFFNVANYRIEHTGYIIEAQNNIIKLKAIKGAWI